MRPALGLPFNALRFHASAALRDARRRFDSGDEAMGCAAVNWADLSVHMVEFWESDTGAVGWRVYVSEASPTAHALTAHVAAYLKAQGLPDVEVVAEW